MSAPQSYSPSAADLWFNSSRTTQIGCSVCSARSLCGGLEVSAPIFDCQSLCACARGGRCRGLCPRSPRAFVAHVRQVGGFTFDNVQRVDALQFLAGNAYFPIVYDEFRRTRPLPVDLAAVQLIDLVNRKSGEIRFMTPQTMRRSFFLPPEARIMAAGIDDDPAIEAWWRFHDRPRLIAKLRALGISFATTPNYSLPSDVTRWDNLHAMKRIALVWAEFVAGGIPCALHLNARTPTDYRRWRDFVGERSEVTAVAFEFLTGAKGRRGAYHCEELIELVAQVGRPLTLVVRGGSQHWPSLAKAFGALWVLDAMPHMKAKNYQGAVIAPGGRVDWATVPTVPGSPIDDLFENNLALGRRLFEDRLRLA